jgi:hypothetical protein
MMVMVGPPTFQGLADLPQISDADQPGRAIPGPGQTRHGNRRQQGQQAKNDDYFQPRQSSPRAQTLISISSSFHDSFLPFALNRLSQGTMASDRDERNREFFQGIGASMIKSG